MDGIRRSRWLLAPVTTVCLWRRMVLWEIRSYPEALGQERERILAKTELQDRYGWLWRWKATRRERALYRLGELSPRHLGTPPAEPVRPALPPAPPKRRTRKQRARSTSTPNVGDLMPLGRHIAANLAAQGQPLTRDRLREAVHNTGRSISTDRAGALLARLKAEGPGAVPEGEAA